MRPYQVRWPHGKWKRCSCRVQPESADYSNGITERSGLDLNGEKQRRAKTVGGRVDYSDYSSLKAFYGDSLRR